MRKLLIAATAVAALYANPALAANGNKQLGKVHFETSCTPAAQKAVQSRHALSALVLVHAHRSARSKKR